MSTDFKIIEFPGTVNLMVFLGLLQDKASEGWFLYRPPWPSRAKDGYFNAIFRRGKGECPHGKPRTQFCNNCYDALADECLPPVSIDPSKEMPEGQIKKIIDTIVDAIKQDTPSTLRHYGITKPLKED